MKLDIRAAAVAAGSIAALAYALCTAFCTKSAVSLPIRSLSCSDTAPRAASSPKAKPAMATTMNSTGPIEVTV